MIAADRQAGGKLKALVVIEHEVSRLRTDVHKGGAFVPVLGQNRSEVGRDGFIHRLFHGDVRLVHGAD